jgi:hypothetical protein
MTETEILYYKEMLERNRLLSFFDKGKMKCLITYFIGNGNPDKYQKRDMFTVIDDEPETGNICYVDHLISDRKVNHKYSKVVWSFLITHIKDAHPQVKQLSWKRFKNGIVLTYKKEI